MQYFVERLFDGESIKHNQLVEVLNGKVTNVMDGNQGDGERHLKGLLAPAYIDIQVNGGGGMLLNNNPSTSCIQTMSEAHRRFGTGSMLPTLITDNIQTMQSAAHAASEAIAQSLPSIIGIHFEGPHLSRERKGIHPSQHIRKISDEEMQIFTRKDIGLVCVTVAPESSSPDCIKALVNEGVLVCLGHTNATDEQVFESLAAGATGFTHLYNAMSPLQGRASGAVGAALLDDASYCGLIVDNEHVSINSCKLAIKCKSANRVILVTDAMAHVGSDQTTLPFAGLDITRRGNKLTIADGTLAGSALSMETAVQNAVKLLGCSIEDALKMASATPAKFLRIEKAKGHISTGQDADWVLLDSDLNVEELFLAGKTMHHGKESAE